jgi:hypothetical protein
MITLTPAENRLRDFLIEQARTADPGDPETSTITYTVLAETLDPDMTLGLNQPGPRTGRLTTALYHLNKHEHERHRPLVGAFAVSKGGDRTSDSGFAGLARDELGFDIPEDKAAERAFWRGQLDQSVEYWSRDREDGALTDAQFTTIMAELATIKRMLRQLMHG